ncbi:MFS transporter [Neobacillus niacini]|uniref:MFS transporter n=1 Tax=Neobacillus niacini TaxID=86668 RepID=UPI003001DEC4
MEEISVGTRKKLYRHIMPFLFLAYVVAFLDRTNVGFAALTMNPELGFTAEIFGFATGLFSIGYLLFEIPGAIWAEKWSAKKWIVRIMVTWGIVGALFGFIQEDWHFYSLRFLLGVAEGGFIPGVLVFLNHWFPKKERAKAIGWFYIGLPISQVVGGPLAAIFLDLNFLSFSGWRWLFIIEGIMAVIVGILVAFYLKDSPKDVKWLDSDEKETLMNQLQREKDEITANTKHPWKEIFTNTIIIRVAISMLLFGIGFYGFNYFIATMTKELAELSNANVGLLLTIPFLAAAIGLYFNSAHSDKTQERRWHTAIPWTVGAIGLLLIAYGPSQPVFLIFSISIAAIGLNSCFGAFWSIPQNYFTGIVAAGGIGVVNFVGNIGGFIGPTVTGLLNESTGGFNFSLLFWVISLLLGVGLILSLPKSTSIDQTFTPDKKNINKTV